MPKLLNRPPSKCNIIGVSYRKIAISIAIILTMQNFSLVLSYFLHAHIPCKFFQNGLYSLVVQFGDNYWSIAGLLTAITSIASNISLLMGALWSIKSLVLYWYIGGIIQFLYLLSLQSYCLSKKFCHNHCEMDREAKNQYLWGFGWCLFITIYFYLTFIFKIQLFYSYIKYMQRPRLSTIPRNDRYSHTFHFVRDAVP